MTYRLLRYQFPGRHPDQPLDAALELDRQLLDGVHATLAWALPSWLTDVAAVLVENIDETAWACGAAGVVLRELYGAPWSTTGSARPRFHFSPPAGT